MLLPKYSGYFLDISHLTIDCSTMLNYTMGRGDTRMTEYYKLCKACRGGKQVLQMGMMGYKDCETCKGLGKIKCESKDLIAPVTSIIESQTIPDVEASTDRSTYDESDYGPLIYETVSIDEFNPEFKEVAQEIKKEILKPKKKLKLKKKKIKK